MMTSNAETEMMVALNAETKGVALNTKLKLIAIRVKLRKMTLSVINEKTWWL